MEFCCTIHNKKSGEQSWERKGGHLFLDQEMDGRKGGIFFPMRTKNKSPIQKKVHEKEKKFFGMD